MKIFLDDVRVPRDCVSYMYQRIGKDNFLYLEQDWLVVKNYEEFRLAVETGYKEITHISFDHDLADAHYALVLTDTENEYNELEKTLTEKTGKDCAQWMKDFYKSKERELPVMFVHSMNPVGTQNIINVFK